MSDPLSAPAPPVVVQIDQVSKRFVLRHNEARSIKERFLALTDASRREFTEDLWALRNVSLTIRSGESVAFVGRNGSGKSTLLRLIAGIDLPTQGQVLLKRHTRVVTMIELGIGFHGELSARENVYLNAAVHGLSRREIDEIYPAIVEYSGLENFMDQAVKSFSSGMHMRLGFAVAVNLQPDVLLLDEIFAVGDADFQRRCLKTMDEFRARGGTLVFVSHSPDAVRQICDRACVLDSGALVFDGPASEGLRKYSALAASYGEALPGADTRQGPEAVQPWHRVVMGGGWESMGDWAIDFLQREGLTPSHFVLDAGCGSLPVARTLLPFMDPGHYWGYDMNRELFNAGVMRELSPLGIDPLRGHFVINDQFNLNESPHTFDFAVAHSLLPRLIEEQVGPCLAGLVKQLGPRGRLYVAVGARGPDGSRPPLGDLVARLAPGLGVTVESRPNAGHPRGDEMMVLVRR